MLRRRTIALLAVVAAATAIAMGVHTMGSGGPHVSDLQGPVAGAAELAAPLADAAVVPGVERVSPATAARGESRQLLRIWFGMVVLGVAAVALHGLVSARRRPARRLPARDPRRGGPALRRGPPVRAGIA